MASSLALEATIDLEEDVPAMAIAESWDLDPEWGHGPGPEAKRPRH